MAIVKNDVVWCTEAAWHETYRVEGTGAVILTLEGDQYTPLLDWQGNPHPELGSVYAMPGLGNLRKVSITCEVVD